ncbi:hypothetical protein GCM10009566_43550 [Streptomyces murinus]|uniref:N-acetyltransferase domain-containing protein n=1 Tax=Streptomyces murinus TaxID=33900 RepID=A0A7W3RII7_STRMR|nr:hypothetical protein [Streptomyces murinus]
MIIRWFMPGNPRTGLLGHGLCREFTATGTTPFPAVALQEIGARLVWRGTGSARRIHEALLLTRKESYVTLMVNKAVGVGKAHALYRSCGYEDLGESQPPCFSP